MSFTVVSALFDIRRDQWANYQRNWDQYLEYFRNNLQLNVNFVIYVEEKDQSFVEECRRGKESKTRVYIRKLEDCRAYCYLKDFKRIQSDPTYKSVQKDPNCPEVCEPLYPVVVGSKLDFVSQTVEENPFNSEYFIWLDAGYLHGRKEHCPDPETWAPNNILAQMNEDKITYINLRPMEDAKVGLWEFYTQHIDVVIGGFFGGSASAIRQFRRLWYALIEECITANIVDDDQYYATILCQRHPELFDLHSGGWYSAFELFK